MCSHKLKMMAKVSMAMLFDAVKNYPVLCDKTHSHYKETFGKGKICMKIAEEL